MQAVFLGEAVSAASRWPECVSAIANAVVAVAAIIALTQVWAAIRSAKAALAQTKILLDQVKVSADQLELARKDIILRSRREALGLALEQCKRYAECISPHIDSLYQALQQKKFKPAGKVDPQFPRYPGDWDPAAVAIWVNDEPLRVKIVHALNELESFAMYFACELADEEVAFAPIGDPFCKICEHFRFFIGVFRPDEGAKLYQNLVKVYGMWKPRLELAMLEQQTKMLDDKKKLLPADRKGKPLGTEGI
jgi:hypothetical protein